MFKHEGNFSSRVGMVVLRSLFAHTVHLIGPKEASRQLCGLSFIAKQLLIHYRHRQTNSYFLYF